SCHVLLRDQCQALPAKPAESGSQLKCGLVYRDLRLQIGRGPVAHGGRLFRLAKAATPAEPEMPRESYTQGVAPEDAALTRVRDRFQSRPYSGRGKLPAAILLLAHPLGPPQLVPRQDAAEVLIQFLPARPEN